jgi:hypothetical protein
MHPREPPTATTQIASYDFSRPGWVITAAAFTQLIWRDTKRIGCAVNAACRPASTYICHFSQAGNVIGRDDWSDQVPRPLPPGAQQLAIEDRGQVTRTPVEPATAAAFTDPSAKPKAVTARASKAAVKLLALDRTNAYRTLHQVDPVKWDDDLAASAAAWAGGCPAAAHSESVVYGENVARGSFKDIGAVIDRWYAEVSPRWETVWFSWSASSSAPCLTAVFLTFDNTSQLPTKRN